tara:strand:+ start:81 stop:269 length:189 start_codon:yes stop_codon:yes gene_type:complete
VRELLQHPYLPLILCAAFAAFSLLSLLSAMNSKRQGTGIMFAILFAAIAAYFVPAAINLMEI